MSSSIYFSNIQRYLLGYVDLIKSSNSLGLTDETIHAENLFSEILNLVFDWNLKNSNQKTMNQDSFDLIDSDKSIYVQVTSNKNRKHKFEGTISSFIQNYGNSISKNFIVFFIAKKINNDLLVPKTKCGVSYEAYDIQKLLNDIHYKIGGDPEKLAKLDSILRITLSPILIDHKVDALLPIQTVKSLDDGLYICREGVVDELFSFTQNGNGLILGGPGYGKSFIIDELQRYCFKQDQPCFVIRINELAEGTDSEINAELNIADGWLRTLTNYSISSGKGILIFDAFDTAKEEHLKNNILKRIRDAVRQLSLSWSIMVSVRTYDASKSIVLQEIFSSSPGAINCRSFPIGKFTDEELRSGVNSKSELQLIFEKCPPQLKELLKTPYFLKLFENIVLEKTMETCEYLSNIETEGQLLEIFWNRKVADDTKRETLLRSITKAMTQNTSLICGKYEVISDSNHQHYDELISQGVITEVSINKQNISFTHNILLDYAISRFFLSENIKVQIDYIKDNPKTPFIFRYSYIFFYSQLWQENRNLFWEHYFKIGKVGTPVFRLFHQTISNYVIIEIYSSVEDLFPILNGIKNDEGKALLVKKLLDTIRFVCKTQLRMQDIDCLSYLSEKLHPLFLWEFGFLLETAIDYYLGEESEGYLKQLSDSSCNYLQYVIDERKVSPHKVLIDHNGGKRGIGCVCKTFVYNNRKAKALLKEIVTILKEPNFPIGFFSFLSDQIVEIFTLDKSLGSYIYRTLYTYRETSIEETHMGTGVILSLRSNRKQDYHMVHYKLEKAYEKLLEIDFISASEIGLEIVNNYRDNIYSSKKFKKKLPVTITGVVSYVVPNYIYNEGRADNGELSHSYKIFDFLDKIIDNKIPRSVIGNYLIFTILNIRSTILWRGLLIFLTKHTKMFKSLSIQLLYNQSLYLCHETLYESGELLKNVWPHLSEKQKQKMKTVIHEIAQADEIFFTDVSPESIISRLLSCIPNDEILNDELQEIANMLKSMDNAPIIRSGATLVGSARIRSVEERMREDGFDDKKENDKLLYEKLEQLRNFNDKHQNSKNKETPEKKECSELFPLVEMLFKEHSSSEVNETKGRVCDYEISRFLQIFSSLDKALFDKEKETIIKIANYYIDSDYYKSTEYEIGDIKDSHWGYSPNARSVSVLTLCNIMYAYHDRQIEQVIISLMNDNVRVLRFKALNSLSYFWERDNKAYWQIIEERIILENDNMCLQHILRSMCYWDILKKDQVKVENACSIFMERMRSIDDSQLRDLWKNYVVLLLSLVNVVNSQVARKLINQNLDINEFCNDLVFEIRNLINPYEIDNNYIINSNKHNEFFTILKNILEFRFQSIQQKGIENLSENNDFLVIDHVIEFVYFSIERDRNKENDRRLSYEERKAYYHKIMPILDYVAGESCKTENGFMVAHTGYYFMKILNAFFDIDPSHILALANSIVLCGDKSGFTADYETLKETVKLIERVLVDHKDVLYEEENFNNVIVILDLFTNSGWQEALELTWRLKEIF